MTAERFVLDASVSLEWFLPGDQGSAGYAADVLAAIESGQFAPAVPDLRHYGAVDRCGRALSSSGLRRRVLRACTQVACAHRLIGWRNQGGLQGAQDESARDCVTPLQNNSKCSRCSQSETSKLKRVIGYLLRDEEAPAAVELTAGKSVIASRLNMTRVIARKLFMGVGDAVLKVDGREIYSAKDLRVGLFTNTDSM